MALGKSEAEASGHTRLEFLSFCTIPLLAALLRSPQGIPEATM